MYSHTSCHKYFCSAPLDLNQKSCRLNLRCEIFFAGSATPLPSKLSFCPSPSPIPIPSSKVKKKKRARQEETGNDDSLRSEFFLIGRRERVREKETANNDSLPSEFVWVEALTLERFLRSLSSPPPLPSPFSLLVSDKTYCCMISNLETYAQPDPPVSPLSGFLRITLSRFNSLLCIRDLLFIWFFAARSIRFRISSIWVSNWGQIRLN